MLEISRHGAGPFRFSGHESFACRYAWLPKAYRAITHDPALFSDDERSMVELGIGKNMVRSLRFWVDAMGVASPSGERGHRPTEFGDAVFAEYGADPYLEDERTLWLLHWNLSSRAAPALFAWAHMLGEWSYPEFTRSEALDSFRRRSVSLGNTHSDVTLGQHLDVFLHTYVGTQGAKVAIEDSLDGPLVGLKLIVPAGERRNASGRWETVYAFRREPKPDITDAVFEYCLSDFWDRSAPGEATLSLRAVATAAGSPGQVFKLAEDDVRQRLEAISRRPGASLRYQPSAVQGMVLREGDRLSLAKVYGD
ncbi:MAG: DUF4007 family protein [Mesorhizobium sp.]|uniref:DUF4007 family protein n=1 Tax=Mesorhizobium sp. M00.F.Ca.ET.217.01.1.1 TaxID=2500529 RepID=UPI000FD92060|nr:DUF4007 family protein [Mesorhizobium sp. M00.F.Ca.ET.217.01.1.1]RWC99752.1 MAG: DUF4007 family protein [Mesorhizobium sp.]TGQ19067.1 DUF4007 family protein [Mesorhizobium sp. M00.F.Ca.ET.217.01.1.1]TGV89955.1 DUF4007 family protein [Mesorhizobium sp. M00.F.Ca.ET.158.01.1.1]